MCTVQAFTLDVAPPVTYPSTECTGDEWTDVATICQLETDREELAEARELARIARGYYIRVRIVDSSPGGLLHLVEEYPAAVVTP